MNQSANLEETCFPSAHVGSQNRQMWFKPCLRHVVSIRDQKTSARSLSILALCILLLAGQCAGKKTTKECRVPPSNPAEGLRAGVP